MRFHTLLTCLVIHFLLLSVRNLVDSAENPSISSGAGGQRISSQDSTRTTTSKIQTTKLKAIELDVKKTRPTDTFNCLKKDGFAKYTPKDGYGFSSVKVNPGSCCSSSVPIWDAKVPSDYATVVVRDGTGTCKSMENVTIFIGNNHCHFSKSNKIFVQDSDIRLYGNDSDNNSTQLDATQYSLDHTDDIFKISFKDDTQCSEVKFVQRSLEGNNSAKVVVEEVSLWNHDKSKHGDQFPIVFGYYLPDKILITFQNFFILYFKNSENKWNEGHLFDFKLFGKTSDNKMKPLDLNFYDISRYQEEFIFSFKKDVKLVEVKHKGNELWKHDPSKNGGKHPLHLRYVPDKIAISFDDSFLVYRKDSEGILGDVRLFDFQLFGKDSNNLKPFGLADYDLKFTKNFQVLKLKVENKCVMVKHKGNDLWKLDPSKHGDNYPITLRYKSDGSMLSMDAEGYNVFCSKDGDKLKANQFFDIDILSNNSGHHYDYKSQIYCNSFTMKNGALCGWIKFGVQKVYIPFFPHEIVEKVELYKTVDGYITYGEVFFTNKNFRRFEKFENTDKWYVKQSPLFLDVKWKDNTAYYNYIFKNKVSTYTPKENAGFRRVRYGLKDVWHSEGVTDYAKKVEMTESDKTAKLVIFLNTGEKKDFNVRKDQSEISNKTSQSYQPSDENGKPLIPEVPESPFSRSRNSDD